jgi:hypothetical protein
MKIQLFKRDIDTQSIGYFPRFKKYLEKSFKSLEDESKFLFINIIQSLADQFSERLDQFRKIEKSLKLLKYPDEITFDSLEINEFHWLKLDNLEMQLIDFKNSIWIHKFVKLRSPVDHMEIANVNNEQEYSYGTESLKVWSCLPEIYNELKKLAMALLTIFSSTYFCKTLFSDLNNIKSIKRNLLSEEASEACLVLKIQNISQILKT